MKRRIIAIAITVIVLTSFLMVPASASITPDYLEATLAPGESITETKTVHIEEVPPKADVVFAFDLTSSMGGIIATAKTKANDITGNITLLGSDVQFGVMSYMDYPHYYSSCGYSAPYSDNDTDGDGFGDVHGDYAYSLDLSITSDTGAVATTINALSSGWGADGPQDYTRIMYESYADPSVGWRSGAARILVNFGDNVPHDCNLNEGVTSGTWSTGVDPGRDEQIGTGYDADNLDLQTVLANMASNGITLLECHTANWNVYSHGGPAGFTVLDFWDYWTGLTGGATYLTGSATLVDDIVDAVEAALTVPLVDGVHLVASSDYESWVSTDPESYDDVERCEDYVDFEVTITVPDGTEEGTYTFTISVVDEDGVNYGDQTVVIHVPPPEIEVPVDIKPTSCPNPLNTKSQGVLPVAILGTEDLDVTQVDPASVLLEGVAPLRWALEDVATPYEPIVGKEDCMDCTDEGPDGYLDLTLKYNNQEIVAALGTVTDGECKVLTLTGNLKEEFGGTAIVGEDVVKIILKKGGKK